MVSTDITKCTQRYAPYIGHIHQARQQEASQAPATAETLHWCNSPGHGKLHCQARPACGVRLHDTHSAAGVDMAMLKRWHQIQEILTVESHAKVKDHGLAFVCITNQKRSDVSKVCATQSSTTPFRRKSSITPLRHRALCASPKSVGCVWL